MTIHHYDTVTMESDRFRGIDVYTSELLENWTRQIGTRVHIYRPAATHVGLAQFVDVEPGRCSRTAGPRQPCLAVYLQGRDAARRA